MSNKREDVYEVHEPTTTFEDGLPKPCFRSTTYAAHTDKRPGSLACTPFIPSEAQRALVRQMSSVGLSTKQIRFFIKDNNGNPISKDTLTDHFSQELMDGLNDTTAMLGGRLLDMAMNGKNPLAAIRAIELFLKCKAGWQETDRVEIADVGDQSDEVRNSVDDARSINDRVRAILDGVARAKTQAAQSPPQLAGDGPSEPARP